MQVRRWLAVVVLSGAAVAGCAQEPPQQVATQTPPALGPLEPSEPFGVTSVTVASPDGVVALSVPVYDAYTDQARRRGLMYRERLPRRAGMVFRFAENRTGGFWMKNTLIPLGIAFFDSNGTVVAVRRMPPCEADPCPSYRPGASYRGALEVNEAFLDQLGLTKGWRIEVPGGLPAPE